METGGEEGGCKGGGAGGEGRIVVVVIVVVDGDGNVDIKGGHRRPWTATQRGCSYLPVEEGGGDGSGALSWLSKWPMMEAHLFVVAAFFV